MFRTIRKKKNEITIDMCDGLLAETLARGPVI